MGEVGVDGAGMANAIVYCRHDLASATIWVLDYVVVDLLFHPWEDWQGAVGAEGYQVMPPESISVSDSQERVLQT